MDERTQEKLLKCFKQDDIEKLKQLHKKYPYLFFETSECTNYDRLYPIHSCAKYNAVKCMEYILSTGFYPNYPTGCVKNCPLHFACFQGNYPMVYLLLETGADPNIVADDYTPIINVLIGKANETTKINIIKKLIEHGADPSIKGKFPSGAYGFEDLFDKHFTHIAPIDLAKRLKQNNLAQYLSQKEKKRENKHSFMRRTLQFFGIFGQLAEKENNSDKPMTNQSLFTTRADETPDYQKRIARIINNLNQH